MTPQKKRELLQSALQYAGSTKEFISEPGALAQLPGLIHKQFGASDTFIPIADENTWKAAGEQTLGILTRAGIHYHEPFVFPGSPMLEAQYAYCEKLAEFFKGIQHGIPIAIGSGTVNDLVKMGAHLANRPYICIATACSVDGYASDGAALLTDGAKITHACPAPRIIVGDSNIMDKAPSILLASGYADLMAKIPAGADWIVADHLGEDPIDSISWNLVQTHLREWLSDPKDSDAIFTGLNLCGIAMQYQKSSRPVSGAEHLMSHIWEMEHHLHNGEAVLHGIKVGIGVLVTSSIYEILIQEGVSGGLPLSTSSDVLKQKMQLLETDFAGVTGIEKMKRILQDKYRDEGAQKRRRDTLVKDWTGLSLKISEQLVPVKHIISLFESVGAATTAAQIGMTRDKVIQTIVRSQLIRNRYTVVDVLDDLGLMGKVMADLQSNGNLL